MSSITGSRHNCEQGQPKPQLGRGAQPTTTTKPQGGGGEGHHHRPHPTGGGGGIPWGGGGGGVWQPCIIYTFKGAFIAVSQNTIERLGIQPTGSPDIQT